MSPVFPDYPSSQWGCSRAQLGLYSWWNKESVNLEDVFEMFFTGKTYRSMSERSDQNHATCPLLVYSVISKSIARKMISKKEKRRKISCINKKSVRICRTNKF